MTRAGVITRVAGVGQTPGYAGDGGSALSALLNNPYAVDVNPAGSYAIADSANHVVRRVEGFGAPDAPTLAATSPTSPSSAAQRRPGASRRRRRAAPRGGRDHARRARQYDTPARYGGEEFAVILPGTSNEDGVEVAERLRLAIARVWPGPGRDGERRSRHVPEDAVDPRALVNAALYESRRGGRNRVTAAAGPAEPTLAV